MGGFEICGVLVGLHQGSTPEDLRRKLSTILEVYVGSARMPCGNMSG